MKTSLSMQHICQKRLELITPRYVRTCSQILNETGELKTISWKTWADYRQMLVLIRHDATAQIIIHTANMIPFDWTNMAQAMWKSPLLPKITSTSSPSQSSRIGSGSKFKTDFINYLEAYDTRRTICKPLIEQMLKYDFSEVRAALVASVPGRHGIETDSDTAWGWAGLKEVLRSVPVQENEAEIVVQISSIAAIGQDDKWLDKTLFKTLATSQNVTSAKPIFRIIFPTADEIRRSLNGYLSGSAIHTKIKSAAQVKQLQYLKPILCHWAGDGAQHSGGMSNPVYVPICIS
jgi:tyrosyl-DNA phosphodiesterase-1